MISNCVVGGVIEENLGYKNNQLITQTLLTKNVFLFPHLTLFKWIVCPSTDERRCCVDKIVTDGGNGTQTYNSSQSYRQTPSKQPKT